MLNRIAAVVCLVILTAACGGGSNSPTSPSSGTTISSLTIQGGTLVEAGAAGYAYITLVQYSNFTSAVVTASSIWTTSNSQIASFTSPGYLSTYRTGSFTITATYSGKTATLNVVSR